MKGADRFLIAIVVGALVIVGIAVAVVLLRPEATYMTDETPEGVAHNYLLALQLRDYPKAYGYLSARVDGYPTTEAKFIEDVQDHRYQFRMDRDVTLKVDSADIRATTATVEVLESTFYGGDLFSSGQSLRPFEMELVKASDGWRIIDSDHYFAYCWRNEDGCD